MAKKESLNQGTCVFIDDVGAIKIRVFNILSVEEDKLVISFVDNPQEQYRIPKKYVRAKRVMIIKDSSGKIYVQNPDNWKKIDLKSKGIKELRFNLQNFSLQESKASIHRWTLPKDTIAKLAPLFKLLMICIVIGVIGWAALKFGTSVLDVVMKSRVMDCSQLIPQVQIPIGTTNPIVNTSITTPIGV